MPATLATSDAALAEAFDVALLDLDGVVYIAEGAVPHAADALAAARERGMRLAFVTNNAARPPEAVAERLTGLGVPATTEEVITSAQAGAHELARRLPAGARVLVVGTTGLREALTAVGLVAVASADDDIQAVAQGYSPDLTWADLAEGAVAIGRGVLWLATNLDATVPSDRGRVPGNGSMVAALQHATGRGPDLVTGKPDPTMHRESVERSHAARPIVVGDRIDTDIAGAAAVGCPSLLVLTGVTDPADVLRCPPDARPSFLSPDLRGLLRGHPEVVVGGDELVARCGHWSVTTGGDELRLADDSRDDSPGAEASGDSDGLDALRALAVVAWQRHDRGTDGSEPTVVGAGDYATAELGRLGLS